MGQRGRRALGDSGLAVTTGRGENEGARYAPSIEVASPSIKEEVLWFAR